MSMTFDVSYVGIVTASITSLVIGFVWYGPAFGNRWTKLIGLTKTVRKQDIPLLATLTGFVATLVTMFILSNILIWAGAVTIFQGATTGFFVWLGFFATTQLGVVLWEKKSGQLYLINTSYNFVTLTIGGAIISAF